MRMQGLTLTAAELQEITGKRRYRAQARALAQMGISYRIRPDGFPLVARSHFDEIMGAESSRRREVEPDWSAM